MPAAPASTAPRAAFSLRRAHRSAHTPDHEADRPARAVLAPDPTLGPGECGLPRALALRLFFFHLVGALVDEKRAATPAAALALLARGGPFLLPLLARVAARHPVLLGPGEALDRSRLQAFVPVLVAGPALRLSPLAMRRMQLVPDGRELTVSLAVSARTRAEVRDLLALSSTLRSPVDGSLQLSLSPEALAGLYQLTRVAPSHDSQRAPPRHFATAQEASEAFARGELGADATVRIGRGQDRHLATAGRCVAAAAVSVSGAIEGDAAWTLSFVRALLDRVAVAAGDEAAARVAQALEAIGVTHATRSGMSLGIDDLTLAPTRDAWIAEAHASCAEVQQSYDEGLLTDGERSSKVVDLWSQAVDRVSSEIQRQFDDPAAGRPLAVMLRSGAVENASYVARKLGGTMGLVAQANGQICERPALRSLRQGLDAHDQFLLITAARAEKIKQEWAGRGQLAWLRRLSAFLGGLSVVMDDCGTPAGLQVRSLTGDNTSPASLRGRLAGRVLAREVASLDPSGEPLVEADGVSTKEQLDAIDREGVRAVEVRSAVGCEAPGGFCAACTGGRVGDPVGLLAAQALVVAASKLGRTMTAVNGPTSGHVLIQSSCSGPSYDAIEALGSGLWTLIKGDLARRSDGSLVVVSPEAELRIEQPGGQIVQFVTLAHASFVRTDPGTEVARGRLLAQVSPHELQVLSDRAARVSLRDLIEGVSMLEMFDALTGLSRTIILDHSYRSARYAWGLLDSSSTRASRIGEPAGRALRPRIVLTAADGTEREIRLVEGSMLRVADGEQVEPGQALLVRPSPPPSWPGAFGWKELAQLLDLRFEQPPALLSRIDGVLSYRGSRYSQRHVTVRPDLPLAAPWRHPVRRGVHLPFEPGDRVRAGDILVDGEIDPSSLVPVLGRPEAAAHLVDRLLGILWPGGASISSAHVELVVAAMLREVQITAAWHESWPKGTRVDRLEFSAKAAEIAAAGGWPPRAEATMVGVAAGARARGRAAG
jgi:DNA-directed RNA polymerase subunit beta'